MRAAKLNEYDYTKETASIGASLFAYAHGHPIETCQQADGCPARRAEEEKSSLLDC